jgi:hypothetical protein
VPELTEIRRFEAEWERRASVRLRTSDPGVVDEYLSHDRVRSGHRADTLDALYRGWRTDVASGLMSIMIAGDLEAVPELNRRAQSDRMTAGGVTDVRALIADGQVAGVGDRVITRDNDRRLLVGRSWVKNGDMWEVDRVLDDGSLMAGPRARRHHSAARELRPAARRARICHDRMPLAGLHRRDRTRVRPRRLQPLNAVRLRDPRPLNQHAVHRRERQLRRRRMRRAGRWRAWG